MRVSPLDTRVTHGMSKTTEYICWQHFHSRCYNPKDPGYINYGGRGVKVCQAWHAFENFYADIGKKPHGYSLERVNNDGDYEPANCQWIPRGEQNRNKRGVIRVVVDGEEGLLFDFMKRFNISPHGLYYRVKKFGETQQEALDHYIRLRRSQRG